MLPSVLPMKKIKLAIDVGNTEIHIGSYLGEVLLETARFTTAAFTPEDFGGFLDSFIKEKQVEKIGLSCVVPRHLEALLKCLSKYAPVFNINPLTISDLIVRADNREELGADFICAYYGALVKYQAPIIVFDLGSATKTMIINEASEIAGVAIKPGLMQSLNAMLVNIPHLPEINMSEPADVIGHNTIEAIKSGIFFGELANIKYYGELLDQHYGFKSTKLVTGGYSNYFVNYMDGLHHEPSLLLTGINKIIATKR